MPTDAEKVAWYDAHFAIPKSPYPACKGPPFDSEWETVSGGGVNLLTRDTMVKVAVWRCRELQEEVERKSAEVDRLRSKLSASPSYMGGR